MRKLGEQWAEISQDGKMHLYKAVGVIDKGNPCIGCCYQSMEEECYNAYRNCGKGIVSIKDLGILNEDGCLPAPWDETKYPKITVLIGNVYNIEVINGHWFMQVRGDTLEKAVERWNRRA